MRDPDITAIARVLADRSRASIIMALLDGEEHSAGELSGYARVGASTTSVHLSRLAESGIVAVRKAGTQRLYRLADERYRRAIEALAHIAPDAGNPNPSLTRSVRIQQLARARRCYDHLGGAAAIAIVDAFRAIHGVEPVEGGYTLTERGFRALKRLGIGNLDRRAPFVRACEDWTEQDFHFGGTIGRLLFDELRRAGALGTIKGRFVRVLPAFHEALKRLV